MPTTLPDSLTETAPPKYERNTTYPPPTVRTYITTTTESYSLDTDFNETTVTIPVTSTLPTYDDNVETTTDYADVTSVPPGGPTKQSKKGEERRCQTDADCEDAESCLTGRCGDPCSADSCSHPAAVCAVRNHTTHCNCPDASSDLSAECRRGTCQNWVGYAERERESSSHNLGGICPRIERFPKFSDYKRSYTTACHLTRGRQQV